MLSLLVALLLSAQPHGTVRTDSLYSVALGVEKHYLVYLPPSYALDSARRYPVAYYLHGLYGDETNWVKQGHLDAAMDSLVALGVPEMIVVMPDGDDGWYTTWNTMSDYDACVADTARTEPAGSYCVRWPHYDDYIAHDLVLHVDSAYRTIGNRAHRAIAGLSMGGYGAITLAFEYPNIWAAAASHSGVLSPTYVGPHPFAGTPVYATDFEQITAQWAGTPKGVRWSSRKLALGNDLPSWRARDPAFLLRALLDERPASASAIPALFMDVGSSDALADDTRAFDAELTTLGIPHEYAEWPGNHNWDYWRAHVGESLAWIASHIARAGSGLEW